jgi:hypothetical protein
LRKEIEDDRAKPMRTDRKKVANYGSAIRGRGDKASAMISKRKNENGSEWSRTFAYPAKRF